MRSKKRRTISDFVERLLTTGSAAAVLTLGIAAGLVVVVGAAIATVGHIHASDGDLSFMNAVWQVLQRTIDPGQLSGERSWVSRVFLLGITLIGLLLISTLISIVNSNIERRIEAARRGRRPVQASGHVVLLGWNDLGTKYAEELAEAYEDTSLQHVVILANEDPVEILRSIKENLADRRLRRRRDAFLVGTADRRKSFPNKRTDQWVTVRRGDPTDTRDLLTLARVTEAKSVIIVSPTGSDSETTQYVLSVLAALQVNARGVQRSEPLPVIAAFTSTLLAERLASRIDRLCVSLRVSGFQPIQLIPVTPDLVRTGLAAQVAPHRGLSAVYRDLLNFDDSELYVLPVGDSEQTFGDIALMPGATVIGLVDDGRVDLWPAWQRRISGASVIVLAETEAAARLSLSSSSCGGLAGLSRDGRRPSLEAERFLFVGWNTDADLLMAGIRQRLPKAEFTVLLDETDQPPAGQDCEVRRRVTASANDPLDTTSFVQGFHHAVVLSHDELSDSDSDARVLADVLACRVQANQEPRARPLTVVAEFRQRSIKHVAGAGSRLADDLLVNDSLSASATVQLAINPALEPILRELLVGSESSTCFMPLDNTEASELVGMQWATVRRSIAERTGELAVAFRRGGLNPSVTVNPADSMVFGANDELVVLTRLATAGA